MVTGLNVFRDYFADDTDKYVLIGGAACDIVFTSNDAKRANNKISRFLCFATMNGVKLVKARI